MDNIERLLLVDGSETSNAIMRDWLNQEGFVSVTTADTGAGALAKSRAFSPDLIIVNVELPDMSGFDLCKKIKMHDRYALVLCVSYLSEDEASRLRARECGADDYLENPDHFQFIAKIRGLMRIKELSSKLRAQYAELEEKNRLLTQHLQMGRRIQRTLIPDIDMWFEQCHIVSKHQSALDVGGDFYNVLKLSDSSLGIIMGDVSGNGVAASFLTVTLNIMIKNLTFWHFNPNELLNQLNIEMRELFGNVEDSMYACVFYAVVDTALQKIYFANAGLNQPLYLNGQTGEVTEMEARGSPIGLMADATYKQKTMTYSQGDMLLFYTDGLQDIHYRSNPEEFSRLLKELFVDLRDTLKMQDMLDILYQTFAGGELSETERIKKTDDVSILLCRL